MKKVLMILIALFVCGYIFAQIDYPIVDTGQVQCFDGQSDIASPNPGEDYYGQDAQIDGNQPNYVDNGDGTITDVVTGLMWEKGYSQEKKTFNEVVAGASTCITGGYTDWRLPSIKELYSLIDFRGIDPSGYQGTDTSGLTPFIDTDYFDFRYGLTEEGERIIDAQYASSTEYIWTTMMGDHTIFGVNFADGRIKGYGTVMPGPGGGDKTFEVKYVRGNTDYGINDFVDNQDGTISDNATELMWTKEDNGSGLNWQQALVWVEQKNSQNHLGYSDWRLPNVKELQSILDYTRAPDVTGSAAIDPTFNITSFINDNNDTEYPYFWSGTTHENMSQINNGEFASYVSFGRGLGWMEMPPNSGNYQLLDVHGAGCQRSDPKSGNPNNYPYGHGPQGDVISIYNYVRLVRDNTTVEPPENLEMNFNGNEVQLTWDAVRDSIFYSVFSSTDPNLAAEQWTLEQSDISTTFWSEIVSEEKKFYYIRANK